VPDECDRCAGEDDTLDRDGDGTADGCDCDASARRCVEDAVCTDGDAGVSCACVVGFEGDGATECLPVDCGGLDAPENGSVAVDATTFGSRATYACDDRYELVGTSVRECHADGTWSGVAPSCERDLVDCGAPPSATGAAVSTTMGTIEGSVATYTCAAGRRLLGGNLAVCSATGSWIGAPATCGEVLGCACSGAFAAGESVRTVVDRPSAAMGLAAGTYGRAVATGDEGFFNSLLVRWSGWTNGHDGRCSEHVIPCGTCTTSPIRNSWYVECAQIRSNRLTCACGGQFAAGDRVVALFDSPSGARGVREGHAGTVVAAGVVGGVGSSPVLIVEWDGWHDGADGCFSVTCGTCVSSTTNNRWYADCALLGRAP
jgi:hypothetical protein